MTSNQNPQPDVSILITNWNGRELLKDCIRSVVEHTMEISYEIIVVDDASTDDSAEMVRKEFPQVLLIQNKKNLGFVGANNAGVPSATGRYVLLLNSDTLLFHNALKVLVDFMDAHPDAGVCGGWLRNKDMSSQVSFGDFPSLKQALSDALFLNVLIPERYLPNRGIKPDPSIKGPIVVDYITGADILIRKTLIDRMGLFDERFQAYCEETDFCYRVKYEARLRSYFVPGAEIIHLVGKSYGKLGKRQVQVHCSSYGKFLKKYHGAAYSFCARALIAWCHLVKLVVREMNYLLAAPSGRPERKLMVLNAWYVVRYSLFPHEQHAVT